MRPISDDLLDEIAPLLTSHDHGDHTAWLDTVQHTTVMFEAGKAKADPEAATTAEEREEILVARAVEADRDGRFVRIPPDGSSPGRLDAFAAGLTDPDLRAQVRSAIRGGAGAFRRVRTLMERLGKEQAWYDFDAAADRAQVREWLAEVGLLPDGEGA